MTPDEYEREAQSADDMAEWHDQLAARERARARRLRKVAAEDREHPPSEDERIRRLLSGR